ncbi:MAG: hypothetical protein AAF841_03995 [Pseudomonadota bacterium]
MERVVFFNERNGDLIEGLLNPETMTWQRSAGVRTRSLDALPLTSSTQTDDTLIYTGGGETTAELELLFDVRVLQGASVDGGARVREDVREMTIRFWELAESRPERRADTLAGSQEIWPPEIRMIWGNWSVPVVVTAVAERLEDFTLAGVPRRSWLTLGLRRVGERAHLERLPESAPLTGDAVRDAIAEINADDIAVESAPMAQGNAEDWLFRLDLLAQRAFGDPRNWRFLAELNNLEDPLRPPPGEPLITLIRGGERAR